MAKRKKSKSNIPFPLLMALRAAVKKRTNSQEEYEKVMMALESLDLKALYSDPEALAKVMANPEGELRNFVNEGVDVDAELPSNGNAETFQDEATESDVESENEDMGDTEAAVDVAGGHSDENEVLPVLDSEEVSVAG